MTVERSGASAMRPDRSEYAEYYDGYVSLVPDGDVLETLRRQQRQTAALLRGISDEQGDFRYAPGKWSIRELIGHIIDSERVFAYRALRIARNDSTPLPGFDQDDYVRAANLGSIPVAELAGELECVRHSTLYLFRHLDADAWPRRGTANNHEVTVRALAFITAGHEAHHIDILQERYLH